MKFNKNELVKSPLNYTGGKYKLLPQILPLFPDNIDTFYDVFAGGASVSLNVQANKIYYNDIVPYVGKVLSSLKNVEVDTCISKIKEIIHEYDLSKKNKEGFEKLRDYYNKKDKSWYIFYVLTCYSFNYQFRFNNKHEYNSSFGKDRSAYTKTTEEKIIKAINRLNNLNIDFLNKDYLEINYSKLNTNDFVYFDPPYLITCGNYNDGKRGFKGWSEQDDICLMELCDKLHSKNIKFALSNVLENKGKSNDILKDWCKKYNVHYLNNSYSNCNYQVKDKSKNSTMEVLITNY